MFSGFPSIVTCKSANFWVSLPGGQISQKKNQIFSIFNSYKSLKTKYIFLQKSTVD